MRGDDLIAAREERQRWLKALPDLAAYWGNRKGGGRRERDCALTLARLWLAVEMGVATRSEVERAFRAKGEAKQRIAKRVADREKSRTARASRVEKPVPRTQRVQAKARALMVPLKPHPLEATAKTWWGLDEYKWLIVDWKMGRDRLTRRRVRTAERSFGKDRREAFRRLLAGEASPQDLALATEALRLAQELGPRVAQIDPPTNEPMTAREATGEILGHWPTDEEWATWAPIVEDFWSADERK